MYNIKDLIDKMKLVAKLKTNIDLANELSVSYNTLNTWLKRKKLPQEVIINFAKKYNVSLDYLLLNKEFSNNEADNLFNSCSDANIKATHNNIDNTVDKFHYYGDYEPLNIKNGDILELNSALFHSNGHYLLKSNDIYFIAKVIINIFENSVKIITSDNYSNTIDLSTFKSYNQGLIVGLK